MPIDYSKYPPNWKSEIRPRILKRAGNRCEHCTAENGAIIRRLKNDPAKFIKWSDQLDQDAAGTSAELAFDRLFHKAIKIVLTVAHLDHDSANRNVKDERLAALCQRCHQQTHRRKT